MTKQSDLWETPQALFNELDDKFKFDIDLCADQDNTKCQYYMADYLKDIPCDTAFIPDSPWQKYYSTCFMNPPYSNPKPFIQKAYDDVQKHDLVIVMLLKCDPSTKAWSIFWDYKNNKPKPGVEVRFLPKRLKFERNGIPAQSANFPNAVVILTKT